MRARILKRACAFFAAAFMLACLPAHAAPVDELAIDEAAIETSTLSDRFELLDKLGNSLTDEESVVIATRVGVLVSINRALNDNQVSFEGEAVGDIVNAGDGCKWANIMGVSNDVISVFMTDEQIQAVKDVGDYHSKGTTVSVTGVYHIACPEHQGELDVHATSVNVVREGEPTAHPIPVARVQGAIVLCSAAVVAFASYVLVLRFRRRRD